MSNDWLVALMIILFGGLAYFCLRIDRRLKQLELLQGTAREGQAGEELVGTLEELLAELERVAEGAVVAAEGRTSLPAPRVAARQPMSPAPAKQRGRTARRKEAGPDKPAAMVAHGPPAQPNDVMVMAGTGPPGEGMGGGVSPGDRELPGVSGQEKELMRRFRDRVERGV